MQSSLSCRTGSELSVGTLPHSRSYSATTSPVPSSNTRTRNAPTATATSLPA